MKPSSKTAPKVPQRQALERSEEQAAAQQPGSYKREATDDKIVEVPNLRKTRNPIEGIDPK
jgi:hypothetical protein